MTTIEHQDGEAVLSASTLVLQHDTWATTPARKNASPLVIRLTDIERLEQQLSRTGERSVRVVVRGHRPGAVGPSEDPYLLHFTPVRHSHASEVAAFVTALAAAVDAGRAPGRPGCLVEVADIRGPVPADTSPASEPPAAAGPGGPQTGSGAGTGYRFNPPPNWPPTPPGWVPPTGWHPEPAWGPAPGGWPFWVPEGPPPIQHGLTTYSAAPSMGPRPPGPVAGAASPPVAPPRQAATVSGHVDTDIGVFGARAKAKDLAARVNGLTDENTQLREHLHRLGALEAADLEECVRQLRSDIAASEADHARQRDRLEADLRETAARERAALEADRNRLGAETAALEARLSGLRTDVVVTEDLLALQEAGVYSYSHPLDDSVAYKAALADVKDRTRAMNRKDGGAVQATTAFTMNGSLSEGRKTVGEFSKLLLRAYNNEADNLVRGMKPYKLATARDRLDKTRTTVEQLGRSMDIRISHAYHRLRLHELELTADHLNKVAEEKEREREEKARLREERQAQAELDRERARLDKERNHYENALAALRAKGDEDGAQRLQEQIEEVASAMEDVEQRAANVRAGYVYVVSNLGSFGGQVVKVGMTRRLDPMDRVRELSDASVPFNFDVHALHFSNDAVGVEAEMHRRLADKRVNRVNHRREFFHTTPAEVRDLLAGVAGDLLQYEEVPEAVEYRQGLSEAGDTDPAVRREVAVAGAS
ncbi:Skp family chaperone for outer membrane proteins [Nocardiopsis arvandica]|uniref:Skp family chaperone for outer membrane proteins n=1 Tax=Nocardiopsis sinuspersici TaxID=501010 RepID=A0A7Y9XER1_9ACTN|nr:DUF4041 domain-containing protein [Nocardiopsis sinuspersici]NYH54504.1 Skp family chaperone for outer membrane proteins [Nocardiopsis sinuspersici]